MSFSYVVNLDEDVDFDNLVSGVREFTGKLVKLHPPLRGLRLAQRPGGMLVSLRVAGLTRWHIQSDAPKILNIILRKFKIPLESVAFESMITERGRSHLKDGQGRTPMTRRPRSERMTDGRPWDHIAWEGDDISGEDRSSGHGSP